jgi:DNA repair protein RadD
MTDIRASFAQHRRVLAVAPTGSGKTVTFAYISTNAAAKGNRVVIVAHRQEIVEQISGALDGMGVRHGRIQPGHRMTADPVQVAMIQTLARRLDAVPQPNLLVIDEAHHGVAGTWKAVASAWQKARILGVTATPRRLDGRGLGDAFDAMVVGPQMAELIEAKHLADYTYLAPPQVADLSGIKTRMGDFSIDELGAAMDKSVITGDAVAHYSKYLSGRPAIAFCVTVAHAEHVAEQFNAAGFRAASVDGKMDRTVRRGRIASIGDGRIQVLTSCDLISEGVDVPVVAGAILLRPTKSLGMFLQQVGRCLRVKPDGGRAMILDHVGNVHIHGMPADAREWTLDNKPKKPPEPGLRVCETCYRAFPAATARADAAGCTTEPCPILFAPAEPKPLPEQVAGELSMIDAAALAEMRAKPLREILTGRESRAELEAIGKARGYKRGWAFRVMQERRERAEPQQAAA